MAARALHALTALLSGLTGRAKLRRAAAWPNAVPELPGLNTTDNASDWILATDKPAWKLFGAGSVGSQALLGIRALRGNPLRD